MGKSSRLVVVFARFPFVRERDKAWRDVRIQLPDADGPWIDALTRQPVVGPVGELLEGPLPVVILTSSSACVT
jgi:hypothetical protein